MCSYCSDYFVKPLLISITETHITENTRTQRKENILYVIVFNYLSDMNTESYKKDKYIW